MCFDFVVINEELYIFFRVIVLESRPTDDPNANSNLYVLAGHENMF